MEIYNQFRTTAVMDTIVTENLTMHVLDAVIGMPGTYSFGVQFMSLNQFGALRNASGVSDLDSEHGMTIFAPSDDAFDAARTQMASESPAGVFANHVGTYCVSHFDVELTFLCTCRSFMAARFITPISNRTSILLRQDTTTLLRPPLISVIRSL